jgi:cell shape-determining protein MreC
MQWIKYGIYVGLVVAAFALLLPLRSSVVFGLLPVQGAAAVLRAPFVVIDDWLTTVRHERAAEAEVVRLRQEHLELQSLYQESKQENDSLRALQKLSDRETVKGTKTLASVVGRAESGTLLVRADREVVVGTLATTPSGVYLGRVAAVRGSAAQIDLWTHANTQTPATVGPEKSSGSIEGTYGTDGTVRYLPKDASIAEGMVVSVPPREPYWPTNLPLGVVATVRMSSDALFQEATVRTPALQDLYQVVLWSDL